MLHILIQSLAVCSPRIDAKGIHFFFVYLNFIAKFATLLWENYARQTNCKEKAYINYKNSTFDDAKIHNRSNDYMQSTTYIHNKSQLMMKLFFIFILHVTYCEASMCFSSLQIMKEEKLIRLKIFCEDAPKEESNINFQWN